MAAVPQIMDGVHSFQGGLAAVKLSGRLATVAGGFSAALTPFFRAPSGRLKLSAGAHHTGDELN